jgi:hypothetical protein
MVQATNIEFRSISESLATPDWHDDWRDERFFLRDQDGRAMGIVLAALSQQMLPYWEARFRRDDKMERLVELMEAWAVAPSPKSQLVLAEHFRSMSVENYPDGHRFLSMPSNMLPPEPLKYRYPGDRAGDSIYHAARDIVLLRTTDYYPESPDAPIGFSQLERKEQTRRRDH